MSDRTPPEVEAGVREALHGFLRAGSVPDASAVEAALAFLAEGFSGMGTGPGDYYPDRAAFGAHLRREKELGPYPSAFAVPRLHVRELRDGLALAEGQLRFEIDVGGETHVVEPRGSLVLERRGDRWLIAHFHFALPNAMQAEGDTLMDTLGRRNRELERLVAERTAELERSLDDLRAAQAQLVQAEKLASLGRLTAGIAHEIKNPLNFVTNFAGLSQELVDELDDAADPAERAALLADLRVNAARIEAHGRRADAIVRAMMAHARGGGGERRAVALDALVEEYAGHAYHGMRARHPGFEVALDRDLAGDAVEVEVVPEEIGRVLINLLDNAFDAVRQRAAAADGPYTPTVRVATRRAGPGAAEVRVADNGPGMPADVRARVFEPFFTTKPPGEGTGLGLSLAYDIVTHGHRGTLACERTDGEGAAFRMTLPAR